MRRFFTLFALAVIAVLSSGWRQSLARTTVPDWPAATRETKPWTRWWWMGSAVDAPNLTANLESLRTAGIGGVEITPIYGVAGTESRFIPYLSDDWVRMLEHTLREAQRLDLGVDMATGTGWPFGGPWVGEADACRTLVHKTWTLAGGQRLEQPIRADQAGFVRAIGNQIYEVLDAAPGERLAHGTREQPLTRPGIRGIQIGDLKEPVESNPNLQALALEQIKYPKRLPLLALVAYSESGTSTDLTTRVAQDGTLDWVAPEGHWTLFGVFLGWHGKLVERAAPGGEGNVIDHFSTAAIRHYLARFDRAFSDHRLTGLRAFFNDSYEVDDAMGQADGTPNLFEEFKRRRGYDLREHLPALFGSDTSEAAARVLADYRTTVSDLLLETFTAEWHAWAARRGAIVRNQAHGSPASLLDLYAASDIPETEGTEIQRARWATSAAHVTGKRLVSAEAATWLGEHFRTTLAEVRAALDRFFIAGVNHIVYHGTAFSPEGDPWPGWLFYASVEFNSRNSWWRDFGALNEYVTRVQSFLQAGRPDQDVLLYYPFYDSLAARGPARLLHFGGGNPPAEGTAFESASQTLERRGYTYDFISDRQLLAARANGGKLITSGGGRYLTVVLPASRFIPLETFERLLAVAREGATVIAFRGWPADVSGLANLEQRRSRFRSLRDSVSFGPADPNGISQARVGRGVVLRGDDLGRLLARAGVMRETLVDQGLQFARRTYDFGRYYFVANPSERDFDGWVSLIDPSPQAIIFDPLTGRRGDAAVRRSSDGGLEVRLVLPRGGSIILAATDARSGSTFPLLTSSGAAVEIRGPWTLRFTSGGPTLPAERTIPSLGSWTNDTDDTRAFSGTATYSTTFARPAADTAAWQLDLGRVCESARVRLNGRDLGMLIGPAFRLTLERGQLSESNVLQVEVTNLMANRITALDRAGARWRKFYNVNFPARLAQNRGADGLFSAAKWEPLESGLLGPVTLTPLAAR